VNRMAAFVRVAELINRMETKSAAAILEKVEGEIRHWPEHPKSHVCVDDVLLIDDAGMREILQRVDKKALTIALKGTSEELRTQFFRNMSSRAVEMMREDMDVLGRLKSGMLKPLNSRSSASSASWMRAASSVSRAVPG